MTGLKGGWFSAGKAAARAFSHTAHHPLGPKQTDTQEQTAESSMEGQVINANTLFLFLAKVVLI